MSDHGKVLDAVAPLKRGKWVSAALRPWTGEVAAVKFEELRSAVEERGNSAVDEAAVAGYAKAIEHVREQALIARPRDGSSGVSCLICNEWANADYNLVHVLRCVLR